MHIKRSLEDVIKTAISRQRSILLLGPRQTGKTTLLRQLTADVNLSLLLPAVRQKYERDPSILAQEIQALPHRGANTPLVIIDEIQKVPELMDVIQLLIDQNQAQFVLTGSSARKLKRSQANLLPGRVLSHHMDPVDSQEYPGGRLDDRCVYGSLPRILLTADPGEREAELESYVSTYLEEEIRAEALVRNLGRFGRFLELAAAESGTVVNFKKLSKVVGVAHTTLMDYFQILEDCLIVERVEPWTESKTRKKLTRSQKYLFFDLGVRRLAAKEGARPTASQWGHLFEQWVALELIRQTRRWLPKATLHFWRDPSGPEVDWVLRREHRLVPIEVKWTDSPSSDDIKHLRIFLKEYPEATNAYLICRAPLRRQMDPRITAVPWQELPTLLDEIDAVWRGTI